MKRTLAIIDDEPLIRKYLTALLSEKYEVYAFSSVKMAIDYFSKNENIDYVLCDYLMDEANGLDFLDFLLNTDYFLEHKKSFCFMTAFENNDVHYKLINTGCRVVGKSNLSVNTIEEFFE